VTLSVRWPVPCGLTSAVNFYVIIRRIPNTEEKTRVHPRRRSAAVCLIGVLSVLFPAAGRALQGPPPRAAAPPRAERALTRVPLSIERPQAGAPVTFGLPLPVKALDSPDHVRVLTPDLREIPSQITEVASWEPQDRSIKWIWVFFFTTTSPAYVLEFGPEVHRAAYAGARVTVYNNQRPGGEILPPLAVHLGPRVRGG